MKDIIVLHVPERSRDSVLPRGVGGLKKRRRPGPLTHNDAGCQTRLDHASGRAVEYRKERKRERERSNSNDFDEILERGNLAMTRSTQNQDTNRPLIDPILDERT